MRLLLPRLHTLSVLALSPAALEACNCEGEPEISRARVEMRLTLVEVDPCSNAQVPRRIPDDYEAGSLTMSTDFGAVTERVFEVRSIGTTTLKVSEVSLSEEDQAFALALQDATGAPAMLPIDLAPSADPGAQPGLRIKITYDSAFARPNTALTLKIVTDDPVRDNVEFTLAAGRGRLQVCATNGCVDDAAIQFGNVDVGQTAEQILTLKNTGDGELDLRSVRLESDSAEFCAPEATVLPEGVSGCAKVNLCKVLKPGEEYLVHVRYSPADAGSDTGEIKVVSGDAVRGNVNVPINATGAGPGICVCVLNTQGGCDAAVNVDFGAVGVGSTERRTVRFVSCGTAPADLTEAVLETDANSPFVTDPEFTISMPFATGQLAPGAHAEGTVAYSPTSAGSHSGGLRYTQAPGGIRGWIALLGRAAVCDLDVLPTSVAFGTIASQGIADRNVLVTNNGAKECVVSQITDPSNGFAFVNKPALPLTVGPGQSTTLTVRFTAPASQTAQPYSSSFEVTSDEPAPGATNTVQLSAHGGGEPHCVLQIQPTGRSPLAMNRDGVLNFGATAIGGMKTLPIRLSNTGNTDCTLQSHQLTSTAGTQFRAAPSGPTPLAIPAGTMASIDVTFAPTGPANNPFMLYGPTSNYVNFTVAGPGVTQTAWSIGLFAQPVIPAIDVVPAEVDFGLVSWENPRPPDMRSSCGSERRMVRVYNTGATGLQIMAIRIDPSSDPVFEITAVRNGANPVNAPYSMMVGAGGVAEVELRFFPTRINPPGHQGLLIIENDVTTQEVVPLRGEGTPSSQHTDTFSQLSDNKIDILWVIDDSASMQEEQNALAANLGSFIAFADSLNADYQVGVVSTDCMAGNRSGKLVSLTGNPADKIVTRATQPSATQVFARNSGLGVNGSGTEQGFLAAKLALSPPLRDMDNAGFLRPDARLAVIVVSDEEDQSPGPVNLYVDFFRNIKGFRNPQLISVSAIAGDVPGGCATADAGVRYHDVAGQMNGLFDSVCNSSWRNTLNNLGLGVFALRTAWTLSRVADPSTLIVRVNGMTVPMSATNGWTFDPASNAVEFHGSSVPPQGASIEVQYRAICIP